MFGSSSKAAVEPSDPESVADPARPAGSDETTSLLGKMQQFGDDALKVSKDVSVKAKQFGDDALKVSMEVSKEVSIKTKEFEDEVAVPLLKELSVKTKDFSVKTKQFGDEVVAPLLKDVSVKTMDLSVKAYHNSKKAAISAKEAAIAAANSEEAFKFKRWLRDGPAALKLTCFSACAFSVVVASCEILKGVFGAGRFREVFQPLAVASYALLFALAGCIVEGTSLTALSSWKSGRKLKSRIEYWAKFLQRVWGRGLFYLLISFVQFGQATGWSILAGLGMLSCAVFCFITDYFVSKNLDALSQKLLVVYQAKMGDFSAKEEALQREKLEYVRVVFNKMDTDNSGYLDSAEFGVVVKELGSEFSQDDMQAVFNMLDDDGNGQLSFEEFAKWWFGAKVVNTSFS